jgi:hypothetical protein
MQTGSWALWYSRLGVLSVGVFGPHSRVLSVGGTGDFNRDGKPDYVLVNASARIAD